MFILIAVIYKLPKSNLNKICKYEDIFRFARFFYLFLSFRRIKKGFKIDFVPRWRYTHSTHYTVVFSRLCIHFYRKHNNYGKLSILFPIHIKDLCKTLKPIIVDCVVLVIELSKNQEKREIKISYIQNGQSEKLLRKSNVIRVVVNEKMIFNVVLCLFFQDYCIDFCDNLHYRHRNGTIRRIWWFWWISWIRLWK